MHMIIFFHPDAKLLTPEDVDSFIFAEFSDEETQPELFGWSSYESFDLSKTHSLSFQDLVKIFIDSFIIMSAEKIS